MTGEEDETGDRRSKVERATEGNGKARHFLLPLRFPEEAASGADESEEPKESAPDWARRRDELSIALQGRRRGDGTEDKIDKKQKVRVSERDVFGCCVAGLRRKVKEPLGSRGLGTYCEVSVT